MDLVNKKIIASGNRNRTSTTISHTKFQNASKSGAKSFTSVPNFKPARYQSEINSLAKLIFLHNFQ